MIELYACGPLSASITRRQCAINQETHISCRGCGGLGALVESVAGDLAFPVSRVRTSPDYSLSGAKRFNVARSELAALLQEEAPVSEAGIEIMAAPLRSVCFDVVDIDDLALIGRVEKIACENGTTLGDEILLWLRVMEAEL